MSFQQQPQLFATGKFLGHNNYTDEDLLIKGIVGDQLLLEHEDFTEPIHLPIEDFTLIARPIRSLTIEETYYVYFGDEQPQKGCLTSGSAEILQANILDRIDKGES